MSRIFTVALAAFAYLSTLLLMPTLSAQAADAAPMAMSAMSSNVTMIGSPDHCPPSAPVKSPGCTLNCASAHTPALPAQTVGDISRWSRQLTLAPAPHIHPASAIIAPDPRPPRSFSTAL